MFPSKSRRCPCRRRCRQVRAHLVLLEALNHRSCRRCCRRVRAHLVLLEALNHRSCRRCCRRVRAHLVLLEALNHRSCRRCCRRVRAHLVLLEALNHRSCRRCCRLLCLKFRISLLAALLKKLLLKFSLVRFCLMCWKVWVEDSFSSLWCGCYPGCFIATLIS